MPFRCSFYVPHFLTSNAQIGKTKVFLRAGQMAELDALRTEVLGLSAKKIQSKLRSYLARKKYIELQQCATQIQAICRGIFFTKIEIGTSILLFFVSCEIYYRVWLLYCVFKGTIARRCYENLRREAASLKMQTCYRMHYARKNYVEICSAATSIQSGLRGMGARIKLRLKRQTKAAVIIQVRKWYVFCSVNTHCSLENDVLLSVIYFYNIRVGSNDIWLQNAISYLYIQPAHFCIELDAELSLQLKWLFHL